MNNLRSKCILSANHYDCAQTKNYAIIKIKRTRIFNLKKFKKLYKIA